VTTESAENLRQQALKMTILVHAISDDAKRFYVMNGFIESLIEPMTLCLGLSQVRQALAE
jgi:hypothetical protein